MLRYCDDRGWPLNGLLGPSSAFFAIAAVVLCLANPVKLEAFKAPSILFAGRV